MRDMVEFFVSAVEPRVRYDPYHLPSGSAYVNIELEIKNASAVPIHMRVVAPPGWVAEETTSGYIGSVAGQTTVRKRVRLAAAGMQTGTRTLVIEAYLDAELMDKVGEGTVVLSFEPLDLPVLHEFRIGINKLATDTDGFTADVGTLTAVGNEVIVDRNWTLRHYHYLTNQPIGWYDLPVTLSKTIMVPDADEVMLTFLHVVRFNHSESQYNANDRRTVSKFEVLLDDDVLFVATDPTYTTVATDLLESLYHYVVDLSAHRGRTGVLKLRTTYRYYSAASTSDFYMTQWFGRIRIRGISPFA